MQTSEDEAEDLADIIPEETVTLDVFDQLANYSGEQIGWFGQIMLDKFNVKLTLRKIVIKKEKAQHLNVLGLIG